VTDTFFDALTFQPTPGVQRQKGTVTGLNPLTVEVRGSAPLLVSNAMPWWAHAVNDVVLVERVSRLARIVATEATRPQTGTVTDLGASTATVNTWPTELPYLGVAPVVGATVAIAWGASGGVITGTPSATISTPTAQPRPPISGDLPAASPPVVDPGTATIFAINTGVALNGSWADGYLAPMQGTNPSGVGDFTGYWFYGAGFQTLQGVTVTSCSIVFERTEVEGAGARPVHLYLHAAEDRGDNPPALIDTPTFDTPDLGPRQKLRFDLPTVFGQALADGAALGIACDATGTGDYLQLAPLDGDGASASSGAITINYLRSV
jgi:hypothetical protein